MSIETNVRALKALGDIMRLRILGLLLERECCVCEVVQVLDISQTRASRNLARLYKAGLLKMRKIDLSVGVFILLGFVVLVYMSINFGDLTIFGREYYVVSTRFSNVSGLQENTEVKLLGIPVGQVDDIRLENYNPVVKLLVRGDIDLPEDTIASIRTQGLLGEQYVYLSPGGLPMDIPKDGSGVIRETESPIILEEVIGQLIFGGAEDN